MTHRRQSATGFSSQQPQDRIRLIGLLPRGLLPMEGASAIYEVSGREQEDRREA